MTQQSIVNRAQVIFPADLDVSVAMLALAVRYIPRYAAAEQSFAHTKQLRTSPCRT